MLTQSVAQAKQDPAPSAPPVGAKAIMQVRGERLPGQDTLAYDGFVKDFIAAYRQVTSCEEAYATGLTFKGKLRMSLVVTSMDKWAKIPQRLAQALRTRPIGTASPHFGTPKTGIRVLILCPAGFKLPISPNPSPESGDEPFTS
jgi:hypothetical protein